MKTAILSVGTEILFGQITNSNTVYLSQQLNLLGFDVLYHYTVGDNEGRLAKLINVIFEDCDLIITTGGLGPTEDDLTKETVCNVFHDTLIEDKNSMRMLEENSKKLNKILTPNNYKQAMMPSRSVIFDNDAGTAPGFALEENGKMIVCMPGPPREMTRMFERRVFPFLKEKSEDVIFYKTIRTFGIGESALETKLISLIEGQVDPTIATYAKEGECTLRIASKRKSLIEAQDAVNEIIKKIDNYIGQYIYSYDDLPLDQVVGRKLIEKNITISCCESCTGGLFSAALTNVPGISEVFNRGLVTYSYEAKENELNVSRDTLKKHTAVSNEVASEMVQGLYNKTNSDICISVTGITGPGGGSPEKPVGLIYIGLMCKGKKEIKEVRMRDVNRDWNRHFAVLTMLDLVNKTIDNN